MFIINTFICDAVMGADFYLLSFLNGFVFLLQMWFYLLDINHCCPAPIGMLTRTLFVHIVPIVRLKLDTFFILL